MKTIMIINDSSAVAKHAGELALQIAIKINANLLVANTVSESSPNPVKELVLVSAGEDIETEEAVGLAGHLELLNHSDETKSLFKPEIGEVDISEYNENDLIQLIIKNDIWLIVKGLAKTPVINPDAKAINIHAVLNRVNCPILLVPGKFCLKELERIVYMADLRYCRMRVVNLLVELAKPYHASLMVAHVSAKGLPHIEEKYADACFNEFIAGKVNYDQLVFNNIKERNSQKVLDIMENEMQIDLVAVVNHRFHFEEIVGRYITDIVPEHVTVPLMVFPI
ncbi:MAG TPA: hypothetical protein VGN20_26575 [Mucilaginibacter sp.]|jgi:nucleotide-binding universal stress UspA family protein